MQFVITKVLFRFGLKNLVGQSAHGPRGRRTGRRPGRKVLAMTPMTLATTTQDTGPLGLVRPVPRGSTAPRRAFGGQRSRTAPAGPCSDASLPGSRRAVPGPSSRSPTRPPSHRLWRARVYPEAMAERFASVVDVCVLLEDSETSQVLLMERANTGFADGALGIPGGHLEAGESVLQGAAREAAEEVGVKIDPADLVCAHVAHHRNPEGKTRLGFFFTARRWAGEPVNMEPDLCAGLHWVDPDALPSTVIPYIADVIGLIRSGESFSVHGW
ncbi:hypothetical protein GCM10009605_42090 [Nocardiopsis composta]